MSKRFTSNKLALVWYAISTAVILAGIVIFSILGFNRTMEYRTDYSLEVRYDTFVSFYDKEAELQTFCEDALKANGITSWEKSVAKSSAGGVVEYKLLAATESQLQGAKSAIEGKISAAIANGSWKMEPQTTVNYHFSVLQDMYGAQWRGGVAIAVAAVVVLGYLAIRCGVSSALAGLIDGAHSFLFTLALIAATRIRVTLYMPILLGGIALLLSLLYHTYVSVLVRAKKKDSEYAGATMQEMVGKSTCEASKIVLPVTGALLAICLLVGLLVQGSVMAFMLPALIPVAVSAYTTLLVMPNVHAFLKEKLGRIAIKRNRYEGAKKAVSDEESK